MRSEEIQRLRDLSFAFPLSLFCEPRFAVIFIAFVVAASVCHLSLFFVFLFLMDTMVHAMLHTMGYSMVVYRRVNRGMYTRTMVIYYDISFEGVYCNSRHPDPRRVW